MFSPFKFIFCLWQYYFLCSLIYSNGLPPSYVHTIAFTVFSLFPAIGILVLLLLIATRVDSPLCKICAEKTVQDKYEIHTNEGCSKNNEGKGHVPSDDMESEQNCGNNAIVDPNYNQDNVDDLDNIEEIQDTSSMDEQSIISNSQLTKETINLDQSLESLNDEK